MNFVAAIAQSLRRSIKNSLGASAKLESPMSQCNFHVATQTVTDFMAMNDAIPVPTGHCAVLRRDAGR